MHHLEHIQSQCPRLVVSDFVFNAEFVYRVDWPA